MRMLHEGGWLGKVGEEGNNHFRSATTLAYTILRVAFYAPKGEAFFTKSPEFTFKGSGS